MSQSNLIVFLVLLDEKIPPVCVGGHSIRLGRDFDIDPPADHLELIVRPDGRYDGDAGFFMYAIEDGDLDRPPEELVEEIFQMYVEDLKAEDPRRRRKDEYSAA